MALVNFSGFETGNTNELTTFSEAGGATISISSSVVKPGGSVYSLKASNTLDTGASSWAAIAGLSSTGVPTDYSLATSYHRFYVYFETMPSSGRECFALASVTGVTAKAALAVNSTGTICILSTASTPTTVVQTSSTALALNTWYRIEWKVTTSASPSDYEVRIYSLAGALLETLSGTCAQSNSNLTRFVFGKSYNISSRQMVAYFDDYAISDSDWIGGGTCVRLAPTANGSTQQWTAGTNSSNYAEVDEVPTDSDTTYVKCSTAGNQKALFEFQKPWVKSVGDTINGVKVVATTKEDSSVTSATAIRLESGASNQEGSTFDGSTSYSTRALLSLTDPDTSAAWTLYGLAEVEAGVREVNSVAVRCSTLALMVDSANLQEDTGEGIVVISNLRNRVDVKKITDRGESNSHLTLPVTITFNKDFADVSKIDVFPISSSGLLIFRIIDFVRAPNPTSFDVILKDENGVQLAIPFTWEAEGVLTS